MLARHKSVGITILALAILRLTWRWLNPTPALPETLKPYQRVLAHSTHALMYLLLFAMPLSGWIMSSARGFPVSWFGFFQLPDLVPKKPGAVRGIVDHSRDARAGAGSVRLACTPAPRSPITSCSRTTCCGGCCPSPPRLKDPSD